MGKKEAKYYTASEIAKRGLQDLPDEMVSSRHLIYSSPATLAYNSPGAEGFGVKRAGLAIPGSVMLLVAPGCCGRNTSLISSMLIISVAIAIVSFSFEIFTFCTLYV